MPKIVDADATKSRIVKATWAVIASEGIQSVSMRRVAAELACSTGLITHYFKDKDELLTLAYKQMLEIFVGGAERRVSQVTGVRERLMTALEAIEPSTKELQQLTVVFMNFWTQAAFNPAYAFRFRADYRRWRKLIVRTIRDGINSGELRPQINVRALVDTLTLFLDGLTVGMTLTPKAFPKAYRHTLVKLLLQPYLLA